MAHRIDRAIKYVLKNSKAITIAETSDFIEQLYSASNLVCIYNTADNTYMLIKFKNEDDAQRFAKLIDKLASVFAEEFKDVSGAPFLWSYQRQFMKTLVSFFDDAKIVCYARSLPPPPQ